MAVQICTTLPLVSPHPIRMKMKEFSPKQLSSVSCPTCGVAAGEGCLLHSSWASRNQGGSVGRIPENVSVSARASVTAGFAKDVDAVNQ
jgi:hypothetical protein